MAESCYDDSIPAGASNFLKLVGKYGYCQDIYADGNDLPDLIDGDILPPKVLDPCHDLYILMCFAAAQVAVGSVQILSSLIGRIKGKSKVGEAEADVDGTDTSTASNGGVSILGVLSWIAGIIMITIYTHAEAFGTNLGNTSSIRFYNSFVAAVWMNVVLFALGLLFIVTLTGIFVFSFIFRKGRLTTLFTFIFSVIVMAIATTFYGCIAYYGWPYIHGDCQAEIESYEGYASNTMTFTLEADVVLSTIDPTKPGDVATLESDIEDIIGAKLMGGASTECLVDDDCHTKFDVCDSNICKQASGTKDECVKASDCGRDGGVECENGKCKSGVKFDENRCASKYDCKAGHFCTKDSWCAASVPKVNAYGYEYGFVYYNSNCTMMEMDDQDTQMSFDCFFEYEADAIGTGLSNTADESPLECDILDLLFRSYQIDMIKLNALDSSKLNNPVDDCMVTDTGVLTTKAPEEETTGNPIETTTAGNSTVKN